MDKIWDMGFQDFFLTVSIIFILLLFVVIFFYFSLKKRTRHNSLRLAEIDNDSMKMEIMFKKQLRKELDDAKMFLKEKEIEHIDSLQLDNSILSRKILYKMNEMDKKTKRIDLGVNKVRLESKIGEIKEHERAIFDE